MSDAEKKASKRYYEKNYKKFQDRNRKYRLENLDKISKRQKEYYEKNKEKIKAKSKAKSKVNQYEEFRNYIRQLIKEYESR